MHLFWCPVCSPEKGLIQCGDKHCVGSHPNGMVYCPEHKSTTFAPFTKDALRTRQAIPHEE